MFVVRILGMLLLALGVFYASLIVSSRSLTAEEHAAVERAIGILEQRGFTDDVRMLRSFAVYRGSDNWLNALARETSFAKTNFPFQIVTINPDFLTIPEHDIERAAILLHEARHLRGEGEAEAYRYVWTHRCRLDLPPGTNRTIYIGMFETKRRHPDLAGESSECGLER